MTTEEKARAYDEALKDMRVIYPNLKGDAKLAVEHAFPVLAESEDERIRKDIIALIEFGLTEGSAVSPGSRTTKEEALAWLEKQKEPENVSASTMIPSCWEVEQKEQKPDSLIYDKDLDKAAREFYLSGGADSPFDSTGLVPIVRMAEFGATWMKERMEKEQKPCWNPTEEDVALFNKAITTNASLSPQERAKLDILRMKFKHRPVIEQKEQKPAECADDVVEEAEEYTSKVDCGEYVAEVTEAYIAGVLAERNRGIEWNEEDEKDMTHIIRILDDCYAYGKHDLSKTDHENLVNKLLVIKLLVIKLKSLRPQPKVELDDEDKRRFMSCLLRLKTNEGVDTKNSRWFETRFASLCTQPHWKPSEEQMKALNAVANEGVLLDLFNDLLKLF